METNEIMNNEEIIETTEEIVEAGSGKGIKIAAGIGLAALGGLIAYKYIGKPVIAKIKAKREQHKEKKEVLDNENVIEIIPTEEEES